METKKSFKLNAEKRDIFGKSLDKARGKGQLPAVFYGPKEKNQSVFVNSVEFKKVWREAGESKVIKLALKDSSKELPLINDVIIYDVDIDPITNEPRHVDFYAPDMSKKITTSVPLEFEGIAPAVKNLSGILIKVVHEVEVEAMPKDLPSVIVVDVSGIETFEDKIIIKDIKVPEGVKILANLEDVVILAEEPKEEEEPEEEAPSLEDIKVTGEKPSSDESTEDEKDKKEEGGGEKKREDKKE